MIRCDHLDRSVCQSVNDRLPVFFRTQRWVHLCHSSVFDRRLFRQGKMMRCRFCVNVLLIFPCLPYQLHTFFGADMLDIDVRAGFQRQFDIPFDHRDLGFTVCTADTVVFRRLPFIIPRYFDISRVFLMETYNTFAPDRKRLHHFLYDRRIHQRLAVIRKTYRAVLPQFFQRGKLLPLHPLRHGPAGINMNTGLFAFFQHISECFCIVDRRYGIGHHHNARITAPFGSCRSGQNIFFMRLPRIPEM